MAEISANCLNCAIGNLHNFSGIMGLSTSIYNCNHENKEVVRSKSAFLYWKQFGGVLSFLIVAMSNYYAIKRTHKAITSNISVHDLLFTSSDITLYFISSMVILHSISQHERINDMYIFFDAVLKDFTNRTSCQLLSKDDAVYFRRRTYGVLILILLFFSVTAAGLYCIRDLEPAWNAIERLGLLISIYSCFMVIIVALLFLRLVYFLNKKRNRLLKMDLENIINGWSTPAYENENCSVVALPRPNVLKLLKVYTDTFIAFNKTFKTFNNVSNPIILLLILFVMFFCVIFVFLVIVCIANSTSITVRFLTTQIGLQLIILATGYTIVKYAKVNALNDEELTLLRKFPSRKLLTNSENFQFDSYLYVVERYQTKMVASEIIAIEVPLFASILSTILTYVLVAVQFEFL